MIHVDVPECGSLAIERLVLDYNGTLACDGMLLPGVREALNELAGRVEIHVLTADTFGNAGEGLQGIPCKLVVLPSSEQAQAKADYLRGLGAGGCAAVGNGRNDRLMLKEAALGMAVVQAEGAAAEAVLAAQVVCRDISEALALLLHPLRLVATLRG